ncbi:MAG: hypothetical protein JW780_05020 [Clostridiales bacterium]|nr:hypothetical protein [Clostridiales bacterium]
MSEMKKRILMTILGVLICGFSVGMFKFSMFGLDPFQVFAHGIARHVPIGFGTLYVIINAVMLVAIFFLDKTKIGLGTLINLFLLGYVAQYSEALFLYLIPDAGFWIRLVVLLIAIVIICLGSAFYFTGNLGVSTYDAIALIMAERKVAKFQYCRIGTDVICTATGFFLGEMPGIGTIITAFFMGPIIAFFNHRLAMPFRYGKVRTQELIRLEEEARLLKKKKTSRKD